MNRRDSEQSHQLPAELRDTVERLNAPPAPRGLIGRVTEERARGLRAVIPGGEAAVAPRLIRPRVLAAASVLLVAGAAVLQRWPSGVADEPLTPSGACAMPSDIGRMLSGSVLFLSVACGQEPGDSIVAPAPPAAVVDANRLHGGTWNYGHVGKDGRVWGQRIYRLSRSGAGGEQEWLAVSSWRDSRRTSTDTLHFAADGVTPRLRVMRRTIDGRPIRHVTMTYAGPHLEVVSDYPGYPSYQSRWSTTLPADLGPIISPAHGPGFGFAHIVQFLPLQKGWEGSVYVAPLPANGYRAEALRVTGDGTVRVPAGTYDCWRVEVGPQGRGWLTLWVAKDSRHLVKAVRMVEGSEGAYEYDTVLLSHEPS